MSARLILSIVLMELKYSTPYFILFLRLNPAVSIIVRSLWKCFSLRSMESLVVPGISVTILMSSPMILLTREDLPTFGFPTNAILTLLSSTTASWGSSSKRATISSRKFPTFLPCTAAIGNGSPKPNCIKSYISSSSFSLSTLFATSITLER